jgi:hypothetical protein
MKQFLTVLLATIFMSCQNTKDTKIKAENTEGASSRSYDCMYFKSDKIRSTTYPFNKADRIEIVSYPYKRNDFRNDKLIVDNKFIIKGIEERIRLNSAQMDTLFSILFDYKTKVQNSPIPVADCYNPRHSILFYKDKNPFAFLEVCLECGGTRKSENTDFGVFCMGKMCLLQQFFLKIGIKGGITKHVCP